MRRSCKLFLAILGFAWASLVLPFLPEAALAADPDELAELLKTSSSPGTDAAKVEALLDSLREAEKRNAEQRSTAKSGSAQTPSDGSGVAPAGPAANSEALPDAVADDAADAEEESSEESETPKRVIRAGCMYSGKKLIWENVPGSCDG